MYLLAYFILKLEKTEEFIKTMDNPETLATLDTQDTERRQTKQNKTKTQKNKMTSTTKLPGLNYHRHHQTTGGEQHGHHSILPFMYTRCMYVCIRELHNNP